jgi:hypothetical protein
MTKSKKATKLAAKADKQLLSSNAIEWCIKHKIAPGLIIWKIHPGLPDGTMMHIKAHPFLIMGFFGSKCLLLPLSKSHPDSNLKPAAHKRESAPAWDAMLLAPPEPSWKPGHLIDGKIEAEFANEFAFDGILDWYADAFEDAKTSGACKIWDHSPISCTRFWDLLAQAEKSGHRGFLPSPLCTKSLDPSEFTL